MDTDDPLAPYLRFDKRFFNFSLRDLSRPGAMEEVERYAVQYRELLDSNSEALRSALRGECALREIGRELYMKLDNIQGADIKASGSLSREIGIADILLPSQQSTPLASESPLKRGRIVNHLGRMLVPEKYSRWYSLAAQVLDVEPERMLVPAFARAFVEYSLSHSAECKFAADVLGGEGQGVFMAWTLLPYIHQHMIQRGYAPGDAMRAQMSWAGSAQKHAANMSQIASHDFPHARFPHGFYHGPRVALGYDERGPSHLFARLLARTIADRL